MKNTLICLFSLLQTAFLFAQGISLDTTFSGDGKVLTQSTQWNGLSKNSVLQPDGKLVVSGSKVSTGKTTLTRYNIDGSVDPSLQIPNGTPYIQTFCIQSDGKIVGATEKGLIRWHSNGSIDSSFTSGPIAALVDCDHMEITALPDDKLVACGIILNPHDGFYVARYLPNGQLDSSFAQNGIFKHHPSQIDLAFSVKCFPNGKIMVAGCSYFTSEAPVAVFGLLPDGTLDTTFGDNGAVYDTALGHGEGYNLALQPDGKTLVVGYGEVQGSNLACVARYLPNGQRDLTFGTGGAVQIPSIYRITGICLRSNGNIVINGLSILGSVGTIVQFNPDGTPDLSFGPDGIFLTDPAEDVQSSMGIHFSEPNLITLVNRVEDPQTNYTVLGLSRYILASSTSGAPLLTDFQANWSVYPNPATTQCTLHFNLQTAGKIQLELYDLKGNHCKTLLQERLFSAGEHFETLPLDPAWSAGTYVLAIALDGKPLRHLAMFKL